MDEKQQLKEEVDQCCHKAISTFARIEASLERGYLTRDEAARALVVAMSKVESQLSEITVHALVRAAVGKAVGHFGDDA